MDEELMDTPKLCEWLKISKATASRWRSEGMPFIGKERTYRYKKSEVLEWLDKQNKNTKEK